jgi:hypothetical protein
MGKLGRLTAFAAEAALWVTGAALVAGAAGAHWNVDPAAALNDILAQPSESPSISAGPTLAPGASATASPVALKYMAYVARPDFQFRAKSTEAISVTSAGKTVVMDMDGTLSYRAGNVIDSHRETVAGAVTTEDYVYVGDQQYESKNGAAWVKSPRPATEKASDKMLFAPTSRFVEAGVETKNGLQLHRLQVADATAFDKAIVKATDGATDADMTLTVWVGDDGAPAAIRLEGWIVATVNGVAAKETTDSELRIVTTSGVTIAAPI